MENFGKQDSKERTVCSQIYHWLRSLKCARTGKRENTIYFRSRDYRGAAAFYEGKILELTVREKNTEETPFYLHFELDDLQSAMENIRLFFDFLNGKTKSGIREEMPVPGRKKLRILISCSCGMTSSYFALLMGEALEKKGIPATVDAVSYWDLDRVEKGYDYIMLAPQIACRLSEFRKKYGSRVMAIDTLDFATRDVLHVWEQICRREQEKDFLLIPAPAYSIM